MGYAVTMDILPSPLPHNLTVFTTSDTHGETVSYEIAELAASGPVAVLDGGNCFPGYRVLRLLWGRVPDPAEAAGRVFVQRASTCYQVLSLLESTPALPRPHVLLDPFATFYDEQIALPEVRRLLEGCLRQVERLRQAAPLLAVTPPARSAERLFLVERLCLAADALYELEALPAPASQPALF